MSVKANWKARLHRVSQMSRDEIYVRAAQEVCKRWDLARSRMRIPAFARRHVLPFGERGRFFFQSTDADSILAWIRENLPEVGSQIVSDADQILKHKFDLLGYEALDYGKEIDWHFDAVHAKSSPRVAWFRVPYLDFDTVGDHKVIWELSRHQHLVTLAKAYRLTREMRYSRELFAEWYQWQQHNPYPIGINWASSLEVAFRSLSWLWVWHLLEGTPAMPAQFAYDLHRALKQNARHIERYLSTYFAPNTHLLGEAVALFFIGTLAPYSAATRRWQNLGWRLILQESRRQVQPDGMHFEQSTYYHVYALDFFLHARILADENGIAIPTQLDDTVERMLDALRALSQTGPLPQFGDDDGGRVFDPRRNQREHMRDPLATGAVLFHRSDLKSAAVGPREEMVWLLGINGVQSFNSLPPSEKSVCSVALPASGIYAMSSSTPAQQQLVIDAGRQGPGWAGHGHADALSVQLSANGKPILIDPGTFTYVTTSGERARFRETGCHNTVMIDGVSQAEPAGAFKWTGLAHAKVERWVSGGMFDLFVGSHQGYGRLATPVVHRRHIFYVKPHFWLLRDVLEGAGVHEVDICWNFAPGSLSALPSGTRFLGADNAELSLVFVSDRDITQQMSEGWFSPRYGSKVSAPTFHVKGKVQLPFECATVLATNAKRAQTVEAIREAEIGRVKGYRCFLGGSKHEIYFSDRPQTWASGQISSDASVVYASHDLLGNAESFALCDGTYLELDDLNMFASDALVAKHEWRAPEPISLLRHLDLNQTTAVSSTKHDR
jgi:hypothetical protein